MVDVEFMWDKGLVKDAAAESSRAGPIWVTCDSFWFAQARFGSHGPWLLLASRWPLGSRLAMQQWWVLSHLSLVRLLILLRWRLSEPPSSLLDGGWQRGGMLIRIKE
jgi:hypothetical protein